VSDPIYYRYNYRQGTGYIVTGAPSTPSATGFEASAQGDLDGNGKISTITLTGDIDPKTGVLNIATQLNLTTETE
jgi:hypothetical protein